MSNPSILDLPDEILVKIILHFDAKERLALADSCQRFNDLVFGDAELLRNLDFTRDWQHTKESDIQQYFNNENTYRKILGINTENVRAASCLSILIGKAINLVELNILNGLRFESVEELSCFLKPLVQLKRLSVNWPRPSEQDGYAILEWNQVLEESFSRLMYLSLEINCYTNKFPLILQFCQQLEELCISISGEVNEFESSLRQKPMKLCNLKFLRLIAGEDSGLVRRHFMCIVPDPAEWTDFYLAHPYGEIYIERNVEVCSELSRVKELPLPTYVGYYRQINLISQGWALVPENLLSEVIRVNHRDAPEKFCCFSSSRFSSSQPCLLRIDETKKLLRNLRYQITYLHFPHVIEENCDVHLLASAFPNLTTLVLFQISNRKSILVSKETEPLQRRLRKKESLASEEDSDARNTDSSFKILVENTPRLEVLVISSGHWEVGVEYWDLDALYLISGWKNLTVIRLYDIPITDGKFLINIGKQCEKLMEVKLHRLGPNENCRYERELCLMLMHCKNLRKLSIQGMILEDLSVMFDKLSNCSRLATLRLQTITAITQECDSPELTSCLEKMLRQCQELKQFSIDTRSDVVRSNACFKGRLRLAVARIITELNRSDFQFN